MFVTETIAVHWLALQCSMIPNVANGMAVLNISDDHCIGLTTCWPDPKSSDPELASAIDLATTRQASVISDREEPGHHLIIAYPLLDKRKLIGVG